MPTNYTGRVLLILSVLVISLLAIFPPASVLNPELSFGQKLGLKPGIDMVGGTSLLYEIKAPEGAQIQSDLANQVMEALKKRVDPNGVMNLIWRPQGATRLEIQMPMSKTSGEGRAKREAFAEAQRKLEATNVRSADVLHAVEDMTGDARRNRLNELAMGSETRSKLFGSLASSFDRIKDAKAKKDAAAQADAEIEYDKLKNQIDDTNLPASALEDALALSPAEADTKLSAYTKTAADFPARRDAIAQFRTAYAQYAQVKGQLDDAADLKRLLSGSGVLEFHILVNYEASSPPPAVREMIDRLQKRGPVVQAGDTMRWYPAEKATEFAGRGVQYNGKTWVLAYTTPDKAMFNRPGQAPWALDGAHPARNPQTGELIVSFNFDPQGAKYFGDLTTNSVHQPLGIVLDDRLISAPNVNEPITSGSGQISGGHGAGGFTEKEQAYLVSMLSAGSLPARMTQ
jgi:preprotein translocase subunit SecD